MGEGPFQLPNTAPGCSYPPAMNITRPRRVAASFTALVTTLVTVLAIAAPAHAVTRSTLTERAKLYYGKSIKEFMTLSKAHDGQGSGGKNEDTQWKGLDWENDGCSAPSAVVGAAWNTYFATPCIRHDFGYRNYGKGLALRSTNAQKKTIDDKFLADMKAHCRAATTRPIVRVTEAGQIIRASLSQCDSKAGLFHTGVRKSITGSTGWGNPETAFHAKGCTDGALCLFDDRDFADRRITFGNKADHPADSTATAASNLKDGAYNFGDKTSSVWNRSPRAWRLYDDSGYSDRSVCVRPG